MGADQVISMEVVLPDGHFISVDENNHPDLFFALRRGGGSTWGIVTSLVVRAYPKTSITQLTYSFGTGVDSETFWAGIDVLLGQFPTWPTFGLYSYWTLSCSNPTDCLFTMAPQLAPDLNQTALEAILEPFFNGLSALGIAVDNLLYVEYDSYLTAFNTIWPPSTDIGGLWTFHTASRLFPASNWKDPVKLAYQTAAMRATAEAGSNLIGYNYQPAVNPVVNQTNAVNPAWREINMFLMLGAVWTQDATPADIATTSKKLVETLQPWREASPTSGTYLNEADINEPNWQQAFYGSNYDYLYTLKQKYDPWGLLYAPTAVGAEDWYIIDQIDYYPTQNGRLCPA